MLKKVGIVVVGATAAALAVSPLAFAADGHGTEITSSKQDTSGGLINVTDTNVNPAVNFCDNQITGLGILPINGTNLLLDLSGAAAGSLLGDASADAKRGDGASLSDDCVAGTTTDSVSG